METNNLQLHLHKNITRLSAIITSGIMITDNSDEDDEWTTSMHLHDKQLTTHQIQAHINALIDNLEELSQITTQQPNK